MTDRKPGEPVAWRWQYDDGEWSQWHRIASLPHPIPRSVEYACPVSDLSALKAEVEALRVALKCERDTGQCVYES